MAVYTGSPSTVAAGETILAALWNSDVRDPVAALSGSWNSYTPTISTSTQGSGAVSGKYIQVGKFVTGYASWTFGSGSAVSTAIGFSLPVTAVATGGLTGVLQAMAYDSSPGTWYDMTMRFSTSAVVNVVALSTAGSYLTQASTSSSVPFTWATGDIVRISFLYEAA